MNEQLLPTFQTLGPQVMDLQVVSFGNAAFDIDSHAVTCQHGPAECDANIYELCASSVNDVSQYLPFHACLFNHLPMGFHEGNYDTGIFRECASESGLDFAAIQACHQDGDLAWKLQKKAAKQTPSNHDHVPWVVINGLHTMDEFRDSLLRQVCDAYTRAGGSHPACSSRLGFLRQRIGL